MKRSLLTLALWLAASGLFAADSSPKDDVIAAAKKLGDKPNYSWKSNVEAGGGNRGGAGATDGKTEKGGFSLLSTYCDIVEVRFHTRYLAFTMIE